MHMGAHMGCGLSFFRFRVYRADAAEAQASDLQQHLFTSLHKHCPLSLTLFPSQVIDV